MLIRVRAFPDAREDKVIKKTQDSFDVFVKEKPVAGLANKAIKELLAEYLKIPESKVRLIRGFKQGNKIFEIHDEIHT